AANKHRFLIVKKDPTMEPQDTETNTSNPEQVDTNTEAQHEDAQDVTGETDEVLETAGSDQPDQPDQRSGDAQQTRKPPRRRRKPNEPVADNDEPYFDEDGELDNEEKNPPQSSAPSSTTDVATRALEALTDVVEAFDAGSGDPFDRTNTLAEQLRAAADALTASSQPAPATKVADHTEIHDKLDAVVDQLLKLGKAITAQRLRIDQLEKHTAQPNSRPAGEHRRPHPTMTDVGWPRDLNRNLDRGSVDKAVSFHDL
ncbi:MAG: hypothetical protein AAFV29_08205, partial [Myxococcota bacterium]